jgi:branched-chain amino acid transport system permease protein
VAPDSFGVFVSIFLFVGLIVGGVSSIGGTLIGAAFIEFIPNLADKVSKAAPGAVYGVILIAVMFLMPAGAGGFLHAMWRKLFQARSGRPNAPAQSAAARPVSYEDTSALPRIDAHAEFAKRPLDPEKVARND